MSTDLRRLSPRTLLGLAVAMGGMLALLFTVHVSRAGPVGTKATTLQQRLESATVVMEFPTEGGWIRQFKIVKDLVVFLLQKTDSSVVVAYGYDGAQKFRFGLQETSKEFSRTGWFDVSEDGRTFVISETVGIEAFVAMIFNIDGRLRFSVPTEIEILPSPSGKYFCTRDVTPSSEHLIIYDSVGHEILRYVPMMPWNCAFLNDECVLMASEDTVRLIDVRVGEIAGAIPLNFGQSWENPPGIAVSPSHLLVVVYNTDNSIGAIRLFTASGELMWKASFPDQLCTVEFDEHEAWLAMQCSRPDAPGGTIRIVAVSNPDVLFESADVGLFTHTVFDGWDDYCRFAGGMITIAAPPRTGGGIQPFDEPFTVISEFDPNSRLPSPAVAVPGLWWSVPNSPGQQVMFRVAKGKLPALLSISAGRKK